MTDSQKFKLKLQRKNKIKHIIFTTLHIIGYVSTIFMIIIFVLVGCQSCSNYQQKQVNGQKEMTQNEVIKLPNYYYQDSNQLVLYPQDILNTKVLKIFEDYINNVGNGVYASLSGNFAVNLNNYSFSYVTLNQYYPAYYDFSISFSNTTGSLTETTQYNYLSICSSSSDLSVNYYRRGLIASRFYKNGNWTNAYGFSLLSLTINNSFLSYANQIKDYIYNGYSLGGSAPTYNTLTLTNTFYPSDYSNRSFTYQVDTQYSTFGDWYNSGSSPLYLIENSYYGWKGLGVIRYYYSNGWQNVTSNVSLSLQNLELEYFSSNYTDDDLQQSYNNGYEEGYDYGFEVGEQNGYNQALQTLNVDYDFILSQSTTLMYLYGNNYLNHYLPNVYKSNYLPTGENSWFYDLTGLTFNLYGDNIHIFDTIKVGFKTFDVFNYENPDSTYFAFINKDFEITDDLVDWYSFEGCTNYLNLLDNSTSLDYKKSHWYYVDSIYYYDSTNDYEIRVFNGLREKELTYYTSNGDLSNPTLVATSVTHNGVYFVKNGWINQDYRRLHVITASNDLLNVPNNLLNQYTLIEFLSLDTLNGGVVTMPVNNVFGLFTRAFSSISDMLNIMILPNITLGVLMFIPLVATIVIVVIRIIKKG